VIKQHILFVFLISFLVSMPFSCSRRVTDPYVENGFADLTDQNINDVKAIDLRGEWVYYRDRFVEPASLVDGSAGPADGLVLIPGSWRSATADDEEHNWSGYFTFHVEIQVDNYERLYSLQTRHIGTAYRVFIDGRELGGSGVVSEDEALHKPGYKTRIFTFQPKSSTIHVTIHTCNYYDQVWGYSRPILFGDDNGLRASTVADYTYDLIIAVFLLVMVILFILKFTAHRQSIYIYFCVVLLAVIIKNLFEDGKILPYFFIVSPVVTHKIVYLMYAAIAASFFFFTTRLYKGRIWKIPALVFQVLGVALIVFSAFSPIRFFFNPTIVSFYSIYTFSTAIFYYALFIKEIIRGDKTSWGFLVAYIGLTLFTAIDVAITFGLINIRFLAPTGFALYGSFYYFYSGFLKKLADKKAIMTVDEILEVHDELVAAFFTSMSFSERETQIGELLLQGKSNQEIADTVFVSRNTVKFHLKNIFQKADVQNRMEILHKFVVFRQKHSGNAGSDA
jgi:two-component system sensor histidine kinase ChiS